MHIAEPPAFALFGINVPKSWKRVKKLVLPMNFLKADDVVASSESTEVVVFSFRGSL